jgi:DNA-nicking Smr family endonuclease
MTFPLLIFPMKKKTDDKAPADFRNTPFKALKGFSAQPTAGEKKELPRRKREAQAEDDSELFLRAVAGARKIEEETGAVPAAPKRTPAAKPTETASRESDFFLEAMKKIGTTIRDGNATEQDVPVSERRSASSRMRQLKRGTIRVSRELDLHGFLKDEALKQLERFIAEAYQRGLQAVLVITGKGINSPEGPVLQGAVDQWLRTQGKSMVAEFAPAPRDLGGSGAFVVFLRKR